ncbi:MAG: HAD-IC family P-type ATPase [Lachnospira sp.]
MRTKTDKDEGLTEEEVGKRTKEGLYNKAVGNQSKTVGQIIYSNVFTYFNLVFAIFAGLLIFVRSYINMTFLPIILCNTLMGIVQEIRAKIVLDRLTVLNAPKTRVIRSGREREVDSETLVLGDICIFQAGSQICADACVVEGVVRVNEALVTGEADEITKMPGDKLLSGSYVVSGECKAELEHVGYDSYVSKLMLEAKASRSKIKTEMMSSLDKLVKIIGILIIPLGIIMFLQAKFVLGNTVQQSVVSVVASLVGMIPEGLYLLASVALVVSVIRLGRQKVLVHEMACVETLARVNVLCVDKTGTITENEMGVNEIVPLDERVTNIHSLIAHVIRSFHEDNITMKTLKQYFDEKEDLCDLSQETGQLSRVHSFSSETKYSAVVYESKSYIIGAPEQVLLNDYELHKEMINEYAECGKRVLVFGEYSKDPEGKPLDEPVKALALIVLSNPIRPQARETFEYFEKQGVRIKVISGDNPVAVRGVAKEAGIEGAEKCIDTSKLSDEELKEAALNCNIFGRVQPKQKKIIIKALQEAGNVVAMTGDGVNDVLALKTADCSVAMAQGSDAAANASQIVLLESDFSKMPSVVLEGRRVVNNIQRSASLFLVKNIFSMLLTIFALISINRYPLYPTQISLMGAFTIGIPAFLLAMQPNKSIIKGHFLTNVIIKALPSGLTDFLVVMAATIIGAVMDIPHEQLSTMVTFIVIMVGILTLIRVCRPFDAIRLGICISMTVGVIAAAMLFSELFAISALPVHLWIMVIVCMAAAVPVFIAMCLLVNKAVKLIALKNEDFRKKIH